MGRRSARNEGQADMHPCCSNIPFMDVVKCSGHDSKSKPFNPALGKGHHHGGMPLGSPNHCVPTEKRKREERSGLFGERFKFVMLSKSRSQRGESLRQVL